MLYADGVPMDDNGRVCYCPRCLNQELDPDSEYCQICGLTLFNTCTGDWRYDYPEHKNKSNARFCRICGLPTTYFNQNLLRPYTEVLKHGLEPPPPLPNTTYDRFIEMSVATDGTLITAEDYKEFSEYMNTNAEFISDPDLTF